MLEASPNPTVDAAQARLVDAVDLAREAIVAEAGDHVGEHLRAVAEDECSVTHYFVADQPGYSGWNWCAVLASSPGDDHITVSEVALLPGVDALTAPQWVPWAERIRPGDLSPGDTLAATEDDVRLVPGYVSSGDWDGLRRDADFIDAAQEIGLGRKRLMSWLGRAEAAERWTAGDHGPYSEMAQSTRQHCVSCGFFIPLTGSLRDLFGVCANEYSADGRVVHIDYGCGAHSDMKAPSGEGSPAYPAYDDGAVEIVDPR